MSTKITVNSARERFDHNENRIYMREKYTARLRVPHAGGLWTASPQLISQLSVHYSDDDTVILTDEFGNPVRVVRTELLSLLLTTYNRVMGEWLEEHNTVSRYR